MSPAAAILTLARFMRRRGKVPGARMPNADLDAVLVTKLLALDEQTLDYRSLLQIARPVREQVNWEDMRARTADSAYAAAFFTLVEGLGIIGARRSGG